VQDHVHAGEAAGGRVLFLPVKGDFRSCLVPDLEQQGARAARRVINGRGVGSARLADADDFGHDPANFGGGIELPLTLATLSGKMPHQVFVGITKDVVPISLVLREVEFLLLKNGDEVGQPVHHLFAGAELCGVVEVRHVGKFVGTGQRGDYLLVDLVPDVRLAFESNHVGEAGPFGDLNGGKGNAGVFIADVLDEQEDEDVILVLTSIHTTTKSITTLPNGGVKFSLLESHMLSQPRKCLLNQKDEVLPKTNLRSTKGRTTPQARGY